MKGWVDGLAEWTENRTAYLSIAFTWKLREARDRARSYRALGYQVIVGGPALFLPSWREYIKADVDCIGEAGGLSFAFPPLLFLGFMICSERNYFRRIGVKNYLEFSTL